MTDAELHDLLQQLFGLGTWDEDTCSEPWWKARALEISKIKRSRTSRNVDLTDLALAARYCKAHGLPVQNVAWLYRHISPAIRWDNERRRAERVAEVDDRVRAAIELEQDDPDSPWLDRLIRARGPYKQEVLTEWEQHRSSTSGRSDRPAASSAATPR